MEVGKRRECALCNGDGMSADIGKMQPPHERGGSQHYYGKLRNSDAATDATCPTLSHLSTVNGKDRTDCSHHVLVSRLPQKVTEPSTSKEPESLGKTYEGHLT
jgi:hypothetical protein